MGLDLYTYRNKAEAESDNGNPIKLPSSKYPDHYCKIGYFRSSYNDGGPNHVLRLNIGVDLYDIFGHSHSDYEQERVDWRAVRERAVDALAKWDALPAVRQASLHSPMGGIHSPAPKNDQEALAVAERQLAKPSVFGAWECSEGIFWPKGQRLVALVDGERGSLYLISELERDGYYRQFLEIVIENCDWALQQENEGADLVLHWSG